MNAVAERTAQLRPADVQGSQGLQIVWLLGPSRDQPPYRVLDSQTLAAVQVNLHLVMSRRGRHPAGRVAGPFCRSFPAGARCTRSSR